MPAVVSFIGRKGSGRSEALQTVIRIFKEEGFRVGVVKRLAKEGAEIDLPGKDTYAYRSQGAEKVILSGRKRFAVYANLEEEKLLGDLLQEFIGYDFVFLEGYFQAEIQKVEIHNQAAGPLLSSGLQNVIAVCSDVQIDAPLGQINDLAYFLLNRFQPDRKSEGRLCSNMSR